MGHSQSNQEYIEETEPRSDNQVHSTFVIGRRTFESQKLFTDNTPFVRWTPEKKLLLAISCPEGSIHSGNLHVSRWKGIELPKEIPNSQCIFEQHQDVFEYQATPNVQNGVEWWVNFADDNLFVAYGGRLFAQDEMQVAEHPILASLKEQLGREHRDTLEEGQYIAPLTRIDGRGTPILIRGIERRCSVAVDVNPAEGRPHGLYGNRFASAGHQAIQKATKPISPPTITHMIAMAALSGGNAPTYSLGEIVDTFTTAYTSFRAAKIESILQVNQEKFGETKPFVIVHTGNWGTGAFGGNKPLMAVLQLLAAHYSGIDKLVYHTFDEIGTAGYRDGKKIFESLLKSESKSTKDALDTLATSGFQWGVSDGN